MNKQRMRRSAAAVTGIALVATFGAVAYFADDAGTAGEVTGGTFALHVNGVDTTSDLDFAGTTLYPVPVADPAAPSAGELLAAVDQADTADITFSTPGYTGLAYATLTDFGSVSPQAGEMWTIFCLNGLTAVDNCTAPMNLADATATTPVFEATIDQVIDVHVWLVDNVPADQRPNGAPEQAQGVTSELTLGFTGITGREFATLSADTPAPWAPAEHGIASFENPAGSSDGFVAIFDGLSPAGAGYVLEPGATITGRAFERRAGDGMWLDAARKNGLYVSVVELIEQDETDPIYKLLYQVTSVSTDDNGGFSFDLDDTITSDNAVLVYISKSAAVNGMSPLVAHSQNVAAGGFAEGDGAEALELADGLEGKVGFGSSFDPNGAGIDPNWFVNFFA